MMEDAHVASWPDGRLAGPVAQIHLFASIYQENELFIRILARSDAGGRRSERQKRFVNGEFIDGVMSMHATPTAIRFFKAAISKRNHFLLHVIVREASYSPISAA